MHFLAFVPLQEVQHYPPSPQAVPGNPTWATVPSMDGFQAPTLARCLAPLASGHVSAGLCNPPDMYFGVSKYFPVLFIMQNTVRERNALEKYFWGLHEGDPEQSLGLDVSWDENASCP